MKNSFLRVQKKIRVVPIFLLFIVCSFVRAGTPDQSNENAQENQIYCNTVCEKQFNEIEFDGNGLFEVTVNHQNPGSSLVCADAEWLGSIKTKIEKNRLCISSAMQVPKNTVIRCALQTNLLNLILAKGNAQVHIANEIKGNSLELLAFGHAKIITRLSINRLQVIAVDSSSIQTSGRAEHQKINLESEALYNGEGCPAKDLDVIGAHNSVYRGFINKEDDETNTATVTLLNSAIGLLRGKVHRLIYSSACKNHLELIGLATHFERNSMFKSNQDLVYQYSADLGLVFQAEGLVKELRKKNKGKMRTSIKA